MLILTDQAQKAPHAIEKRENPKIMPWETAVL